MKTDIRPHLFKHGLLGTDVTESCATDYIRKIEGMDKEDYLNELGKPEEFNFTQGWLFGVEWAIHNILRQDKETINKIKNTYDENIIPIIVSLNAATQPKG